MDDAGAHLQTRTSDRGFDRYPPIPAEHGGRPSGHIEVYESSAALAPHIWISAVQVIPGVDQREATVHLSAESAWRFAEQILHLVRHHYHGDAVPAWARERAAGEP
jgi:hypothetical protein